jgi:hypothetical protein
MTRRGSFRLAIASVPVDTDIPAVPDPAAKAATIAARRRDNKPDRRKEPDVTEPQTVAVVVLGLECGLDVGVLVRRLGADVIIDAAGIRVVTAERAKAFIDATNQARQREREAEARRFAEAAAQPNPIRQRIKALRAKQDAHAPADTGISAFAAMISGTDADPLQSAGQHMDEMLAGATTMRYHKIKQED